MSFFPRKHILFLLGLSLSISQLPYAQLCTGSLGAPIVNRTFGAGSNPGQPLGGATTNYSFVANDCPVDGSYTVRNNTTNCFSSSWHNLTADHTGDAGGYFMLVNASVQPGSFFIDTVRGLCAGTTFEFAAWVVNVLKSSACGSNGTRPNLTFSIERTNGVVIQQYATGDIANTASPQWLQYGFFFTTPVGITDIVLRIVNNAPGGCGNDLALDDITFRPCGPLLTTSIDVTGSSADTICQGQASAFVLNSTISNGYSNPVFQWQSSFNGASFSDIAGAVNPSLPLAFAANAAVGTYSYRLMAAEAGNMSNIGCRVISSSLNIIVEAKPTVTITTNSPVCENSDLQINASSSGTTYQWTGPNAFSSSANPVVIGNVQTNQGGKYYLITSTLHCSYTDSATVVVNPIPIATINISAATICEGDTVQLVAGGGTVYDWLPATSLSSPNSAITNAYPSESTIYRAVVKSGFNCADTVSADIVVVKKASTNAGPDLFTIVGTPVRLQAVAGGGNTSYTWTPATYLDSPFVLRPLVNAPAGEYLYQLVVSSAVACGFAPDLVKVTVYDQLYVPSAFTPNSDGKNDRWIIPALSIFPEAEVLVYNRYGELIFREKGSFKGWDGTYKGQPLPTGAYVYMVKPGDTKLPALLKGTITLIR